MESDDDLPDVHNWDHELGTHSRQSEDDKRQKLRDKRRERDQAKRLNETAEQKESRLAKERSRKAKRQAQSTDADRQREAKRRAKARANETPEQTEHRRTQDAAHRAEVRANETPEQTAARNAQNAANMAEARANETPEQTEQRRTQHAAHMANVRANETPEQTAARNDEDAERKRIIRAESKSHVDFQDAMKTVEILNGTFIVRPLHDTDDNIGSMTEECPHCKALKFPRETPSSCCQGGKVALTPYPRPPEALQRLWLGNDERSVVLKKFSRTLNNAVSLTSLKNHAPVRSGWQPTVIFQGKVTTRAGPLLPSDGETPMYTQLYVHDPGMESTTRYNNMVIPDAASVQEKLVLREVLETVQQTVHEVNPFVQDFKQIVEMSNEDLLDGKIVISAKAPRGEHVRLYNLQTNLKEVSILTDSQPHDLVLQKRGGGIRLIHDMNPKGMPLHFVLLFPHGTYGWDETVKHCDGRRRVTTREYYVFHLNIRNLANQNFLHMAGRLF